MTIIQWGAICLLLAAPGGMTMAWMRVAGRPHPPAWLPAVHGLAAIAGLVLVAWSAIFVAEGQNVMENVALGLVVLAAAGGITLLLGYHARGLPLPVPIIIVHGMLGIVALAVTLVAAFADFQFART